MNCQVHKQPITGICAEKLCKYQSRAVCSDCQFSHGCASKMPIKEYQTQIMHILNLQQHSRDCAHFTNAPVYRQIEQMLDQFKKLILEYYSEAELKEIQSLISGDERWNKIIVNLSKDIYSELDSAIDIVKQKAQFDQAILKAIKNHSVEDITTTITKLEKPLVYDKQYIQTITKQQNIVQGFQDLQEHLKFNQYKSLSNGHTQQITTITNSPTHLITGSEDGRIIGWIKPSYNLDYRIQTLKGLNTLSYYKSQERSILFAGHESIQSYSTETKQKLFQLRTNSEVIKLLSYTNLIAGCRDGSIQIWDVKERETIQIWKTHIGPISDLYLDKELISIGQDGKVCFYNLSNLTIRASVDLKQPIYSVIGVGSDIYIGMSDGRICIIGTQRTYIHICQDVIWKIIKLSDSMIACISDDNYLNLINLNRLNKIYRHPISPSFEVTVTDGYLMLPQNGQLLLYR